MLTVMMTLIIALEYLVFPSVAVTTIVDLYTLEAYGTYAQGDVVVNPFKSSPPSVENNPELFGELQSLGYNAIPYMIKYLWRNYESYSPKAGILATSLRELLKEEIDGVQVDYSGSIKQVADIRYWAVIYYAVITMS